MKRLPKTFQGADVVRGLGMDRDKLDLLIAKKTLAAFDATKETFLVVAVNALEDGLEDMGVVVRCFADEDVAIRYARAMANGNVDHRVLRVSGQTLVIGTRNEL